MVGTSHICVKYTYRYNMYYTRELIYIKKKKIWVVWTLCDNDTGFSSRYFTECLYTVPIRTRCSECDISYRKWRPYTYPPGRFQSGHWYFVPCIVGCSFQRKYNVRESKYYWHLYIISYNIFFCGLFKSWYRTKCCGVRIPIFYVRRI